MLLVAAVIALVWANSPWSASYLTVWSTELTVQLGRFAVTEDLHHWVNDGLMAVFFFVVGLEIKRELVLGELRDPRAAAVPALAALGGMLVPAGLYLAVNAGGIGTEGWGIPMATDIAFAVGIMALLGERVPVALKLFLLTLAIVDDIGAILVIAVFYSDGIEWTALGTAALDLVVMMAIWRAGLRWMPLFVVAGIIVWLAMLASGVHATIAGVLLGLLTPARPVAPAVVAREWAEDLSDDPTPEELAEMTRLAKDSVSVAERLQHLLHPWTSFVIVPLFALANAGVVISSGAFDAPGASSVAVGVAVGLVLGKVVGISGATWLAVRFGIGRLPRDATWAQVVGVSMVAGIGFTVSLFITELAFDADDLVSAAKLSVLLASTVAAAIGALTLVRARP